MANKVQRKVNKVLREFNKGFAKDINPYNEFRLKQFKRMGRDEYETMFLVHVYRGDTMVASGWFDTHEITGLGNEVVGRRFFWFVNNKVAENKNGAAKDFTKN
jgi:hypothetical protein